VTETKTFPTAVVLSTVTGRLICDINGVYEVLSYMTGESVYAYGSTVVGADKVDDQVRGFVPDPQGYSLGHAGVDAPKPAERPRPVLRVVQPEDEA
jgi:hypothetical protein